MLNRLIKTLEQETIIYENLFSLLKEERALLSKRVTDEIHQMAGSIEVTMSKAVNIRELRTALMDDIAKSFGLVGSDKNTSSRIKLSSIIQMVEGSHHKLLKNLQSKLLLLVEGIDALSKENRIVIDRGINNIESAYLFLREISAPTATYQSSGKMG